MHACWYQPDGLAGGPDLVEHPQRELGWNVELPAQFAHVGAPDRRDPGVGQVDLLDCPERKGLVAQVGVGEGAEHAAALRAEDTEYRIARGHVRQGEPGVVGCVPADPVGVAYLCGEGGDHEEPLFVKAVHREVSLNATTLV